MILAILQARMSSTRLPGKVLKSLAGAPMIWRQIERVSGARRVDYLVVATSTDPSDDILAETLEPMGLEVVRGPLDDVLARFVQVLDGFPQAEQVVRLTADCPLADPTVIDGVIDGHMEMGADYSSNAPQSRRTFPKGLDVEVMRPWVLRRAGVEATDSYEREHVTPFVYRQPGEFHLCWHHQEAEEGEVRWTVDRPDDYAFVGEIYDALHTDGDRLFTSDEVRAFVRGRLDLHNFGGDRRV
ncbi:MAG TPA: glycosyltransferase family protein [Caulobacteraceae bacterium]